MGKVVQFNTAPQKPDEEWAGDAAICIGCRNEWAAVSPVGTRWLECPACGSMKGIYKKPFGAGEGDSLFTCNCGSEAMTAYHSKGLFYFRCMNCGADHTETIFGS